MSRVFRSQNITIISVLNAKDEVLYTNKFLVMNDHLSTKELIQSIEDCISTENPSTISNLKKAIQLVKAAEINCELCTIDGNKKIIVCDFIIGTIKYSNEFILVTYVI